MAKKINAENQPSTSDIASLAYQLFEQEGRPQGRDMQHWLEAELLLKSQAPKPATISNNKAQPKNSTNSMSNSRASNSLASLTR